MFKMSTSLVIVALPAEDDLANKISSEKVPHLTLMYLGEATEDKSVTRMAEFIEHALSIHERGPFYLEVDYRGELGDDNADVLFFKGGWEAKWIKQLRGQLLQQSDIRTAYESVEQFPEWVPHLTLGYPTSPANPVPDDRRIYSVEFDRIAVWSGNYEGPEFRLKWPEYDGENMYPAVAYSGMSPEAVADLLHSGVKGMRWGVRKSKGAASAVNRKIPKGLKTVAKDIAFETEFAKDDARGKVARAASTKWANEDVPRINADYKGTKAGTLKGRLKNPLDPKTIEYRSRSRAAFRDRLNEEVAQYTNASGTRKYEIEDGGSTNANYMWTLKVVDVKRSSGLDRVEHAAKAENPFTDFRIRPIFDDEGFIVALKQEEISVEQDGLDGSEPFNILANAGEEFIKHYGVKGMRWGIRNRRGEPVAVTPQAISRVPHGAKRKTKVEAKGGENHPASDDALKVEEARVKLKKSGPKALSNQELREVADRLRLEQQVVELNRGKGSSFVRGLLKDQGKSTAKAVVRETVETKTGIGGGNNKKK